MFSTELVEKILALALDRFEVHDDHALVSLAPENITDVRALKLRRLASKRSTSRTILVAFTRGEAAIKDLARWTAEVRDALLEPETSDLYLFLVADGLEYHACARIESDEQFCRKYVAASIAEFPQMLERTFLSSLTTGLQSSKISDPIAAAFQATHDVFPWFETSIQEQWLKSFTTNKPGKDMVPEIIDAEPLPAKS
jgi:hypothetical protein